jgi:type II secretory pathway pseudopilin PulG
MQEAHKARAVRGGAVAFTLIEVLVTVTILAMIILMLSMVFQQSHVAWGAGMRRTRVTLQGRMAVDFMAHELQRAVADAVLPCSIAAGSGPIEFYAFTSPSNRAVSKVRYELAGGTIKRTITWLSSGGYPTAALTDSHTLLEDVLSLNFTTPPGGPAAYTTNLPAWVGIAVSVNQDSRFAQPRVSSWTAPGGHAINSWELVW